VKGLTHSTTTSVVNYEYWDEPKSIKRINIFWLVVEPYPSEK
jgi:hypothetical protein